MMKKVILVLMVSVISAMGDEAETRRVLRLYEKSIEEHEETMRVVRGLSVSGYLDAVVALELRSVGFVNGLRLIGAERYGEKAVRDYVTQAAACLAREVELRKRWRILAEGKMTKKQRAEVGKYWVAMEKVNDALAAIIGGNTERVSDLAVRTWKEREAAKAGPRAPEPEIVGE